MLYRLPLSLYVPRSLSGGNAIAKGAKDRLRLLANIQHTDRAPLKPTREAAASKTAQWWPVNGRKTMNDFLGMALIINEQRERIAYLEFENKLLFDHLKGDEDDLKGFNQSLEKALSAVNPSVREQEQAMPKFEKTWCSNCGKEFGPGDHGYSHCRNHRRLSPIRMNRRSLIVGVGASAVAAPAKAEDAETARFRDALERIAMLDEADGHDLTVRQAFQAVAIACVALGNKHPSVILVEREARIKAAKGE